MISEKQGTVTGCANVHPQGPGDGQEYRVPVSFNKALTPKWTSLGGWPDHLHHDELILLQVGHWCNSGHCWGSAGDGLMWVGCRCECKTFIQLRAPPTLLVFKPRPHFFHCSSFVLIQKSLFGEPTPVNWSLSSRHNDRLSLIVFSLCTVRICTTYTSHLHYQHTMDMKVKISALWWLTKKRRAYSQAKHYTWPYDQTPLCQRNRLPSTPRQEEYWEVNGSYFS